MYHKVSATTGNDLTVTVRQLAEQIAWLRESGHGFVTIRQLVQSLDGETALPAKPVLVTFDDAYVDTLELALPVLREAGVRAAVFVPTAFLGQSSAWERDAAPIMTAAQLSTLAAEGWELALHSHRHLNFATLAPTQIAAEVRDNLAALRELGFAPAPALAYPFGRRPRDREVRAAMRAALQEAGVRLAFRIGNRINPLPLGDCFEVNRLGPRGDESFGAFQRKLRWGRLL